MSLGVVNEKRSLAVISSDEKREEGAEELPSRNTSYRSDGYQSDRPPLPFA